MLDGEGGRGGGGIKSIKSEEWKMKQMKASFNNPQVKLWLYSAEISGNQVYIYISPLRLCARPLPLSLYSASFSIICIPLYNIYTSDTYIYTSYIIFPSSAYSTTPYVYPGKPRTFSFPSVISHSDMRRAHTHRARNRQQHQKRENSLSLSLSLCASSPLWLFN